MLKLLPIFVQNKLKKADLISAVSSSRKDYSSLDVRKLERDVFERSNEAVSKENLILEPKAFNWINGKMVLEEYPVFEHLKPLDYSMAFSEELNPNVLDKINPDFDTKIFEASNFAYPYGSVALFSKLNEPISTTGLWQCAALAAVDRKNDMQTLFHCCPTLPSKSNMRILKYIFSKSNPDDLEISLVPGCYKVTGKTISFLLDAVDKYAHNAKINFYNFPINGPDVLLLRNGELSCINPAGYNFISNPVERIIYVDSESRKSPFFLKD